jgi:hypothetical protein
MSVARQRFLADVLKTSAQLNTVKSYEEALFGPWRYQDDQHSLGWDPSTLKLGAFTYRAPTTMANTGVRAAVWLAFESLPLFPCFYRAEWPRGLRVRGFERRKREFYFCWPVWNGGIGLETLATLLGFTTSGETDDLAARGISALYRSERFKPNQYMTSFRPAELAFGGASAAAE